VIEVPNLDVIASRLEAHQPHIAPPIDRAPSARVARSTIHIRRAAVALLIAPGEDGPELLFIERARREGDYWSGDIAFPGGRRDDTDPHIEHTARRETWEEIGVGLPEQANRLDDFDARTGRRSWPLVVTPFAYLVGGQPECRMNYEVADVLWVPIRKLIDPRAAVIHTYGPQQATAPAIQLDHRVVWGMTLRMLEQFLGVLDLELPKRS